MMCRIFLIAALLLPGAAQARDLRFVGTWDCGITMMTFTETTYDAGAGPKEMQTIEGDGHEFTMTFSDGYRISVAVNDAATEMQWLSHASGDSFTCSRKG